MEVRGAWAHGQSAHKQPSAASCLCVQAADGLWRGFLKARLWLSLEGVAFVRDEGGRVEDECIHRDSSVVHPSQFIPPPCLRTSH